MKFYDVAQVLTTHGLKGEVKLKLITDFPEKRFAQGNKLTLRDDVERVLTVEASRPYQQFWLVQFVEITTVEEADALRGKTLVISAKDQHELPNGSYYYHDILGCIVVDNESGQELGEITAIESPGANDVWEVTENSGKSYLIPYIDDVVKRVDVAGKKVYVELMEGLRDED